MNRLWRTICIMIFLSGVYFVLLFVVYATQHHILFRSQGVFLQPPANLPIEEVSIKTNDGETLYGWWLQQLSSKKTILFFQGNGRNITHLERRLRTFLDFGVNALVFDYRGYGKSSGYIRSEEDVYRDAEAAWNFVTVVKGIPPEQITLWGRSLGGGVAVEAGKGKKIHSLILESTFYSLDEMAGKEFWFFPTKYLLKFHFDNGRKLKNNAAPILILHSPEDRYIPFEHAVRLFHAASGSTKRLLKTSGSHLDQLEDSKDTVSKVKQFIQMPGQDPLVKAGKVNF